MFNTYGELSNGHLLHMYGFAEPYPDNHYDEVHSKCNESYHRTMHTLHPLLYSDHGTIHGYKLCFHNFCSKTYIVNTGSKVYPQSLF